MHSYAYITYTYKVWASTMDVRWANKLVRFLFFSLFFFCFFPLFLFIYLFFIFRFSSLLKNSCRWILRFFRGVKKVTLDNIYWHLWCVTSCVSFLNCLCKAVLLNSAINLINELKWFAHCSEWNVSKHYKSAMARTQSCWAVLHYMLKEERFEGNKLQSVE